MSRFLRFSPGVFLCLVFLVLVGCLQVFGQATTGSIRGVISDPNGQVVPGATVVAKNEATGVASPSFTSSSEGTFVITNLPPGAYSLSVTAPSGFKKKTITGINVQLGLENDLKVALEIGAPQETVTIVAGSDETIQSTSSEVSSNFDSTKVLNLPSNAAGGGIDTIALNTPGVTPGFGNVNSNGTTLSVNGNRARSNNFTINGTDNNDLSIGGPSFFVGNSEIVQEFQVITNNYSAQYGRNQGAIVNIVTKGGTNEFSGTAFLYHRNSSSLDAMTNIERREVGRSRTDKFVSNVFGGVFGGPAIKNKLFFFGSYQGIRQAQNFTARGTQLAILSSEFTRLQAAFPGNNVIKALTTQGAFALSNFGKVRPRTDRNIGQPNNAELVCISATSTNGNGNCRPGINQTEMYLAAFPEREFALPFTQDEFTVRGDWNITDRDNLTVNYLWQDGVTVNSLGGSGGFTGDVPAKSQNLSGFYTRQINSSIVNNFQGTFQRLFVKFGGGCTDPLTGCVLDPAEIGASFSNLQFSGLRGFLTNTQVQTIGQATNLPQGRTVDVVQFADKVSWIAGQHTMQFGVDLQFLKNSVPFLPNINGSYRFNTGLAVATNAPTQLILADGATTLDYKQRNQFYFFQDDWKVLRNLTLNLGVRYEYSGQPINILNDLTTARENDPAKAFYRTSLPIEARTVPKVPADKNNFAPRVGFAWAPNFGESGLAKFLFGGRDATVFRGGFSMAYEQAFYNILLNIQSSAPVVLTDTLTTAAGTAAPLPSNPIGTDVRSANSSRLAKNTFDPRLLNQTIVSSDFHSPYSLQYSFGMQRQINGSNVFEVRYVGNRGKDLFQTINGNPLYSNIFNGFSQTIPVFSNGLGNPSVPTVVNFPSFASLLPAGTPAPQVCVNNAATPDNEAACNGRLLAGRGLIRERSNTGSSQYDSLQTRYNGRFLNKNLILGASYTFSKAIDNASEIFSFGETAGAQNPFDVTAAERGLSGFDRRHAFSMNYIYEVPFFKDQKGFVGKLLGGFQITGVYNLASGRPYTPVQFCNSLCTGGGYQDNAFASTFFGQDTLKPFLGNPNAPVTSVGISQIDARAIFGVPVQNVNGFYLMNDLNTTGNLTVVTPGDVRLIYNGQGAARIFGTPFGSVARNTFRGPKLNNLNIGVFKTTNITEKLKIQFRMEAFNFLNHPNPSYGVSGGATLPDNIIEDAGVTFGDFREIELSSRRMQFGLRIIF